MTGIDEGIILIRTLMFDIMPDQIRRCVVLMFFIGIVYSIRKIVHLGGGD